VILQVFQEREKRGQALLKYSRILDVVSGHTRRNRGCSRFPLDRSVSDAGWPTRRNPCDQSGPTMTSELETGVSEPTDVIASRDTVLGTHGVDYFARREHVQLQGKERRLQVVPVFLPNTGQ
jgi:hypothetical protein